MYKLLSPAQMLLYVTKAHRTISADVLTAIWLRSICCCLKEQSSTERRNKVLGTAISIFAAMMTLTRTQLKRSRRENRAFCKGTFDVIYRIRSATHRIIIDRYMAQILAQMRITRHGGTCHFRTPVNLEIQRGILCEREQRTALGTKNLRVVWKRCSP